MPGDDVLRQHLVWLLQSGDAHMPLEDAVAAFPLGRINEVFPQGTYSAWALLEHLRLTQWDILDFVTNPAYQERAWPQEYWPAAEQQATAADWQRTLAAFVQDRAELVRIVEDPQTNLYRSLAHGSGQTILREILLVADHNAYHIGEFAIMRQVMGTWPPDHH
jgi:hypothetical protein